MGCNYYLYKKDGTNWTLPVNRVGSLFEHCVYNEIQKGNKQNITLDMSKCITEQEGLHIGKSSSGWHFSLCIYPYLDIYNLEDWKELFENRDYYIMSEDYEELNCDDMLRIITERKSYSLTKALQEGKTVEQFEQECVDKSNELDKKINEGMCQVKSYDELLAKNHAEKGLNGLMAHGDSIWDMRGKECWEGFIPTMIPHFRTDGTYDLTPDWDFS